MFKVGFFFNSSSVIFLFYVRFAEGVHGFSNVKACYSGSSYWEYTGPSSGCRKITRSSLFDSRSHCDRSLREELLCNESPTKSSTDLNVPSCSPAAREVTPENSARYC